MPIPVGSSGGSSFLYYAVVIKARGSIVAHVLTALEWQNDQANPGPEGASFKELGGYNTFAEAQAAVDKFNALPEQQKIAQGGVTSAPNLPNPLHGIAAIGDFFNRLTEKQTWVRVGEVGLGALLVYVGARALASGSSAVGSGARKSAVKPVKKVAKTVTTVAAPEVRFAAKATARKAAPKTSARVAAHRTKVKGTGPKPPRTTIRESHIYHHKGPKP